MPRTIAELREIAERHNSALLRGLLDSLEQRQARMNELLQLAELDNDQAREFDDLTADQGERSIPAMHARADQVAEQAERAARAQAAATAVNGTGDQPAQRAADPRQRARVTNEPTTYQRGGSHSYFRDLTAISLNRADQRSALSRMERNREEVRVDMEERALSPIDGAGGEFVPPVWMLDEFVALARAGRVTADRVRGQQLPGGTDSINLPKIVTGTAVAEQTTPNTAVQNTDATTGSVTGAVATLAGQQVVAVQLIEQSPVNMDDILLGDLAADYAVKADVFVLSNNATNKVGLLNVSGVNAVTFTQASPTVALLYPKVADGIQQIHTNRLLPPELIEMHPRRWAWFLASLDSSGRPLVTPYGGMNSVGDANAPASQGLVGSLQGLPVYVDPNIPINLGTGTNEDRIIIGRFSDAVFYEGTPRSEAFRETKADQLSVLLRFYNYAAFIGNRYPKSFSVIAGTGLATPTF